MAMDIYRKSTEMSKKYYITESQFKKVIKHINTPQEEILEEGFKEVALAGLLTLASMAGIKAQDTTKITPDHVKAAEMFQDRLDAGDKEVIKYFKDADIEWNRANVEKLKDVDDGDFEEFSTKSMSVVKAKEKQGFAVTSMEITKDTIWDKPSEVDVQVVDTLEYGYDSDQMFRTGSFELTPESMNNLNETLKQIEGSGGKLISVTIESSTDTEPIRMGNDVLAQKRANSVENVLTTLGVDVPININTLPEQGPDVFNDDMSDEERTQARQQTSDYRYVKVSFVVVMDMSFEVPPQTKVVKYIRERVKVEMVRVKPEYKTIKGGYKWKGKVTKPKKLKCKKVKVEGDALPCFFKP